MRDPLDDPIIDRVPTSDSGLRGEPAGGGPVGIGSHLTPHLRISQYGPSFIGGFILNIRPWWGPLSDWIVDRVGAFGRLDMGDLDGGV